MSKAADLARTASASETALGNRNLLINGANTIWQRGASLGSGVNRYVQDRWYQWGYGAIPTQQTGINGIGYSTRLQHNDATANSFSSWNQSLETSDTVYARGNKTTFSVYIKKGSAFTGTLNLQIVERTDAEGSVNTGTRNVLHSENIAGSLSTSFQKFTITSNNNVNASAMSIGVNIDHGGTSGTDSNNYFEFTQAQLEVGTVATPFEHRSYGQELALCQRYFQLSENAHAIGLSSSAIFITKPLAVQMRASPTIGQTGVFNCQNGSNINTSQSSTGLGSSYSTTREIYLHNIPNFSGLTAKEPYICPVPQNNGNKLTADAEL